MSSDNGESSRNGASARSKVLLVDDHPIVRRGLAELINLQPDLIVTAQSDDAAGAVAAVTADVPDIAVTDLSLQEGSGIDLIRELKTRAPQLPVLVLSMHEETLYAERALRAGASGYIMKHEATDKVLIAIRRVLSGEVYLAPKIASTLLSRFVSTRVAPGQSPLERLSDRELEIFNLIGQGLPTRQIADKLSLGGKTVDTHREHIKQKLGFATANELLRFAIQHSLGNGHC
jgi:DNA-binding NarL/FixJ family response regulator